MADSNRLEVLVALTTHLNTITPANGYEFDVSGKVFRGRAVFGENDQVPLLSILEAPRPDFGVTVGPHGGGGRSEQWQLLLQGWAADDEANPTDPAYRLMADVEKCLHRLIEQGGNGMPTYADEYLLGRRIGNFKFGPGVVRPPEGQPTNKAFFYLPLQVEVVT